MSVIQTWINTEPGDVRAWVVEFTSSSPLGMHTLGVLQGHLDARGIMYSMWLYPANDELKLCVTLGNLMVIDWRLDENDHWSRRARPEDARCNTSEHNDVSGGG